MAQIFLRQARILGCKQQPNKKDPMNPYRRVYMYNDGEDSEKGVFDVNVKTPEDFEKLEKMVNKGHHQILLDEFGGAQKFHTFFSFLGDLAGVSVANG